MLVRFVSDQSVRKVGFQIVYKSAPPPSGERLRREAEQSVLKINRHGVDRNVTPRNVRDIKSTLRVRRFDIGSPFNYNLSSNSSSWFSSLPTYDLPPVALTPPPIFYSVLGDPIYYSDYEAMYNNFDPYSAFGQNMTEYDWRQAYEDSTAADYSDLRPFARFSLPELWFLGTQADDFIAQCTYDGRDCGPSWFKQYPNPIYGNCFIFNSIIGTKRGNGIYSEVRNTSKTGKENGLKLTLFLDKEEYIGVLSQSSAAQVSTQNLLNVTIEHKMLF